MILQLFFRSEPFVTLAAFIVLIIEVSHDDSLIEGFRLIHRRRGLAPAVPAY